MVITQQDVFEIKRTDMKKIIAIILLVSIATVGGIIWWNSPVHFLNVEDVAYIKVFNGNNGKSYVIDNKEDVSYIVNNISDTELRKTKISLGYMGYKFRLSFFNVDVKEIDKFILNDENTIRKDPFFYESKTGELCIEYLWELDDKILAE